MKLFYQRVEDTRGYTSHTFYSRCLVLNYNLIFARLIVFLLFSGRHIGLRVSVSWHEIGWYSLDIERLHCYTTARQLERIFGWCAEKAIGQLETKGTDEEEWKGSGHQHWTLVATENQQRASQVMSQLEFWCLYKSFATIRWYKVKKYLLDCLQFVQKSSENCI